MSWPTLFHRPIDFFLGESEVDGAYNLGAITFQRDLEEHAQELARILKPGAAEVCGQCTDRSP